MFRKLEEACKGYQLLREANDLAEWIKSRVSTRRRKAGRGCISRRMSCINP